MALTHSRNFSAQVTSILCFLHSSACIIISRNYGVKLNLCLPNSNTSQVHVRTSGVSSEVGNGDSNSEVNAVLGQMWVGDSQ